MFTGAPSLLKHWRLPVATDSSVQFLQVLAEGLDETDEVGGGDWG